MARKILGGCYGSDSGRATSQYSRSYPAALPYYSAYYWLALRRESLCNKLCTAKDLRSKGRERSRIHCRTRPSPGSARKGRAKRTLDADARIKSRPAPCGSTPCAV